MPQKHVKSTIFIEAGLERVKIPELRTQVLTDAPYLNPTCSFRDSSVCFLRHKQMSRTPQEKAIKRDNRTTS